MGTATMTAEEVGGYMRLLCYAWDRGGLPDDDTQLAKMAGVSPESLNQIRCKFVRYQDGLIRNERMELERRKQAEYRAAQSHNGAKGAAKRWHSDGIAVPSPKNSDPMISPMAKNSSPSPSPSPSLISEFKQDTQKGAKAPRVFVKPTPGDVSSYSLEIGYPLNGEAWCDSYAQKGWLVGKNKMKDWKAAVRNWKANGWKPDRNGQHQNQLPMDPEAQRRLDAF